jgi:2-polyprenyl-3-methyl-5-hydroxy-6-metoxy-1,4-benzoquinol methylase
MKTALRTRNVVKQAVKKAFATCGFAVTRINRRPSNVKQYFNSGKLSPHQENDKDIYNAFYGDEKAIDEYYKSERLSFYREVISQIRQHELELSSKHVLDVGCGVGHLLASIRSQYRPASLSGCDFSEAAIEASSRKFPGMKFFQHDIRKSLPDKYDVIFCTEVLEHVADYPDALAVQRGALKSRGALVLTVPNGRTDNLIEHLNFWSPESWAALMRREFSGARIMSKLILDDTVNLSIVQYR